MRLLCVLVFIVNIITLPVNRPIIPLSEAIDFNQGTVWINGEIYDKIKPKGQAERRIIIW